MKVALNAGVASGDSLVYSFQAVVSGAGCGSNSIQAEYKRNITALDCNGTPCSSSSVILGTGSSAAITVVKPDPVIANIDAPFYRLYPGYTVSVTMTVRNNSSTENIAANTYAVDFYCGYTFITSQVFPGAIPAGSTVTNSFNVAVPNTPTCNPNHPGNGSI